MEESTLFASERQGAQAPGESFRTRLAGSTPFSSEQQGLQPPDFEGFRTRLRGLLQEFEQMEAWSLKLYAAHVDTMGDSYSEARIGFKGPADSFSEIVDVDKDNEGALEGAAAAHNEISNGKAGLVQQVKTLADLNPSGKSLKSVVQSVRRLPSTSSLQNLEQTSFLELKQWFERLDKGCLASLNLHQVGRILERRMNKRSEDDLREVLIKLNLCAANVESEAAGSSSDLLPAASSGTIGIDDGEVSLTLQCFMHLLWWHDMKVFVKPYGRSMKEAFLDLREALIVECIDELIMRHTNWNPPGKLTRGDKLRENRFVDYSVAVVILANAATMGIRVGRPAKDFVLLEGFFTIFFVIELVFNVWAEKGPSGFFCGRNKLYNMFDLFIVILGIFGYVSENFSENTVLGAIGSVTLGRLVRLFRLTKLLRLIRILRIEIFKPLNMMLKGVMVGMRTLLWAIVLMLLIVYTCSVFLTQTVGQARLQDNNEEILFKTVGTTMFAVFRCFMGDCALSDGTPMPVLLEKKYGFIFTIPFSLLTIFVVFGLFNLIMAIFVETVQEAANQKISMRRDAEIANVWLSMREMVLRFGGARPDLAASLSRSHLLGLPGASPGTFTRSRWIKNPDDSKSPGNSIDKSGDMKFVIEGDARECLFPHGAHITSGMFHEALEDPDVCRLFDELEIYVPHKVNIFSVLDSDGNNELDVSELISGMLKLRSGGADRSDIVEMCLMIKSVQKKVSELAKVIKHNFDKVTDSKICIDVSGPDHDVSPELR